MNTRRMLAVVCMALTASVGCATVPSGGASTVSVQDAGHAMGMSQARPAVRGPTNPAAKKMTMLGYGKVFYDADVCDLSFSVVTLAGDDLSKSFDDHRKRTREISEFMLQYGGADTLCAAKATVLNRNERRVRERIVEEYEYRTDYSCRFTIKEEIAALQKELVTRGVNQIPRMELRSSKYNQLLREARNLALADARAKVEYIAEVTGWEIVELVDAGLQGEGNRSLAWEAAHRYGSRGSRVEDTASPFETYIDATMQATFLVRKKEE